MKPCGVPFRTGPEVRWQLRPATGVEWRDVVLPPGVAATVSAVEDHHGGSPLTAATVVSIATAHCLFDPRPVAGSGVVASVHTAERWTSDSGDQRFAGILVRAMVTDGI